MQRSEQCLSAQQSAAVRNVLYAVTANQNLLEPSAKLLR
jgi:hypothetical protein